MKKSIAMLLSVLLLFIMVVCQKTDYQPSFSITTETQGSTTAETEVTTDNIESGMDETTSGLLTESDEKTNSEASSEPDTELPEQPNEEELMEEAQFYITANSTTFTANFAENGSADAFRDLLREGDLTINMRDYGSFEKVGSIGISLPRKDTQISTSTGDVVLYQGNQIVIFYGTNNWSYSRLGKVDGVTAEALLSAFGSGDVAMTFSLTKPQ